MFLRILEISLLIIFIAGLISQVAIPLWRGTQLFPIFRKESKLEAAIAAAKQAQVERGLKKTLGDLEVVEVDVPSNPNQEQK